MKTEEQSSPTENPQVETGARTYYERNTPLMVALGTGRGEAAIHRAVWTPGVGGRREALHAVERRIAESLGVGAGGPGPAMHLLDLGCGVGASAVWLASRYPVRVTGVTLSPTQAAMAERLAAAKALSARCHFLAGDFQSLPALEPADGAYAIEASSHATDVRAFFREAARILRPGAILALCDDFTAGPLSGKGRIWVERFRKRWHLGPLPTRRQAVQMAGEAGLVPLGHEDLTGWLRPDPPGAIGLRRLMARLPLPGSYRDWLAGGAALQVCLRQGWLRYLLVVLQKP